MKQNLIKLLGVGILSVTILLTGCKSKNMSLTITNPSDTDRLEEMIEIPLEQIQGKLNLQEDQSLLITNQKREEIPYQITYNNLLIFPTKLQAAETQIYTIISSNKAKEYPTIATGKTYPERFDDLAWENDLVGFRAYGPALQAKGDKAYGYDLFAKRGTTEPVLEGMYAKETNTEMKALIKSLRETDPKLADSLHKAKSYHIDKGHGMDCYAVGPTLGAGVAALVENNEIVYPWCYKDCEILDNGPLRFTAKLTFTPLSIAGNNNIIETRIISLDKGSHFNKTIITYEGIDATMPIVSGIVLHNNIEASQPSKIQNKQEDTQNTQNDQYIRMDKAHGYISYQDPTTGPGKGEIYIGHAYSHELENASTVLFTEQKSKEHGNAKGHVLAHNTYKPGEQFTYWWGFGWSHSDIATYADWNEHLAQFAAQLRQPLAITIID